MGTSNFHSVNAHNTYAIFMSYEQPKLDDEGKEIVGETETVSPESWECDDFIAELKISAEKLAIENNVKYYKSVEKSDPHELHSFPSTELFQLYTQKTFGDIEVQVNINCVIRSGYYEGACLDWYITASYANEVYYIKDIDYTIDEYMSNMNAGLRTIIARKAQAWVEKSKDMLVNIIEEFYKINSTPLMVTARFSNGETVYQKI
ncbi:MAG: hypothetical protein RIR01_2331 [Bacteroidota bacterium]|jgi:hypothetical protein